METINLFIYFYLTLLFYMGILYSQEYFKFYVNNFFLILLELIYFALFFFC